MFLSSPGHDRAPCELNSLVPSRRVSPRHFVRLSMFSSTSMLVSRNTRLSYLSLSLKAAISKQGFFKSLALSSLIRGHLFTVSNYISTMASALSITSANKISLEEFKRVLKQYPALIKRVSDGKGGK